jgi:LmbE family N-acetylglucosaminyl deacetylase
MSPTRLFAGPDDSRLRRALCIVAHPDDIEFFCAGTVLLLARRGVGVEFVLATSGDKGTVDDHLTGTELARLREAEQRAAAGILGAGGVRFLRHRDAELVDDLGLRRELVHEIRLSRPDVIFTFDPTPAHKQHPDHRAIGRAALDAAWPCARDRLTYPEEGPPHKTAEAWLFGGPDGALRVDVSGVLETKIEARLEHRTQTGDPQRLRTRWRRIAREERFTQVDLR